MAAIRDAVSYVKYSTDASLGIRTGQLARVYSFGSSQSGRFLRTFLYEGFNGDEAGRRVLDGVMAHVAGGGRGGFNLRFAQPSRDGHPFMNLLYPTDIYPFSDAVQRDPETGLEEGILGRYRGKEALIPKIFYTNSSYEYWGRAASQIHTTLDGTRDLAPAANTRIYQFAGTQHGTGPWPPARSVGQELVNPNRIRPAMRALLVAMDAWVRDGVAPPDSRYGRIDNQTLVRPEDLRFPALPGRDLAAIRRSGTLQKAWRADYGPRFRTERIIDFEPPKLGKLFPTLVPQVDADGNELAGIRLPDVTVPLGTYTGWNLFNAKSGPTDVFQAWWAVSFPSLAPKGSGNERRSQTANRRPLPQPGRIPGKGGGNVRGTEIRPVPLAQGRTRYSAARGRGVGLGVEQGAIEEARLDADCPSARETIVADGRQSA